MSALIATGTLALEGSFLGAAAGIRRIKPAAPACVYDEGGKLTAIRMEAPEARKWPRRRVSFARWQAVLQRKTGETTWEDVGSTDFDDPYTRLSGRRFKQLAPPQSFSESIPAEGFLRVRVDVEWRTAKKKVLGVKSAFPENYNGSAERGCAVQKPGSAPQGETPVWWGNAERTALNTNSTLVDTEQGLDPIVGDYDGDGKEDILWYSATGDETIWWGAGRTFEKAASAVLAPGGYKPVAGDYDGDGKDDIHWYKAGTANDFQWWGSATRAFEVRTNSDAGGTYDQVVSGNYNGDAYDDIFFYRHPDKTKACEYKGAQFYWYGKAGRGDLATGSTSTLFECYFKWFSGDIDGDGKDDQLAYGLSPNDKDMVVFQGATPTNVRFAQPYGLRPVLGDFEGDGRTDIYWFSTSAADSQWWGPGMRSEFLTSYRTNLNIDGDFYPVSGDFDGDGRDDILWYAR